MFIEVEMLCKECGKPFDIPQSSISEEIAKGYSNPTRCRECQESKLHRNQVYSMSYLNDDVIPKDMRPPAHERKYGLGFLNRGKLINGSKKYGGVIDEALTDKFKKINPYADEIVSNVNDPVGKPISMLVVPTGLGKSTWLPYKILLSNIGRRGRILMTQPRTITLRANENEGWDQTVPGFIASKLLGSDGIGYGKEVGLLYRNEATQKGKTNRLLFCTDGILIRFLETGQIDDYDVVIVDEAHEQSENMEIIFQLIKENIHRKKMKFVIASATINTERFTDYFGSDSVQVVEAPPSLATLHDIHIRWPEEKGGFTRATQWMPRMDTEVSSVDTDVVTVQGPTSELSQTVVDIVVAIRNSNKFHPPYTILNEPFGDVLVFVPTIAMVDECVERVSALDLPSLEVYACHAQLEDDEYARLLVSNRSAEKAVHDNSAPEIQRVIIGTNYAETSITFPNLRYVIDSGFIMKPRWKTQLQAYEVSPVLHSQAGCIQRAGRVGRRQSGEVFRLYTERSFKNPKLFSLETVKDVEINPLDKTILRLANAGIPVDSIDLMGLDGASHSKAEMERAVANLRDRGALSESNRLSNYGTKLSDVFASTSDESHLLSMSDRFGCLLEMAVFVSFVNAAGSLFTKGDFGEIQRRRWSLLMEDDLSFYMRVYTKWIEAKDGITEDDSLLQWLDEQGFRKKYLESVDESVLSRMQSFTLHTHEDASLRELDVKRLHRVRIVLAICLPERVFRCFDNDKYASLTDVAPGSVALRISPRSVCHRKNYSHILFMQRTVGKNKGKQQEISVQHIIKVSPEWPTVIKERNMLELAEYLQNVFESERELSRVTESQINGELKLKRADIETFKVGEVRAFIPIHSKIDNTEGVMLSTCITHDDRMVTLRFSEIEYRHDGTPVYPRIKKIFVVTIEEILPTDTLVVSQKTLFERMKIGSEFRRVISKADSNTIALLDHAVVEIEPNFMYGIHKKHIHAREIRDTKIEYNSEFDLVVHDGRGPGVLTDIILPKRNKPVYGLVYHGVVNGFSRSKENNEPVSAWITLTSGVDGRLNKQDTIGCSFSTIQPDQNICVRVTNVISRRDGKTQYQLKEVNKALVDECVLYTRYNQAHEFFIVGVTTSRFDGGYLALECVMDSDHERELKRELGIDSKAVSYIVEIDTNDNFFPMAKHDYCEGKIFRAFVLGKHKDSDRLWITQFGLNNTSKYMPGNIIHGFVKKRMESGYIIECEHGLRVEGSMLLSCREENEKPLEVNNSYRFIVQTSNGERDSILPVRSEPKIGCRYFGRVVVVNEEKQYLLVQLVPGNRYVGLLHSKQFLNSNIEGFKKHGEVMVEVDNIVNTDGKKKYSLREVPRRQTVT